MFCTKCGKQLSDIARFCSGCGNPVAKRPVVEDVDKATMSSDNQVESSSEIADAAVPEYIKKDFAPKNSFGRKTDQLPQNDRSYLYYLATKINGFRYAEQSEADVMSAVERFAYGADPDHVLFLVNTALLSSLRTFKSGFVFSDEKMYYYSFGKKVVVDYANYAETTCDESNNGKKTYTIKLKNNSEIVLSPSDYIDFYSYSRAEAVIAFLDAIGGLYTKNNLHTVERHDFMSELKAIVLKYEQRISESNSVISTIGNIPPKKFENAKASYAYNAVYDQCLLLTDNTVFGSSKSGILISIWGIYCSYYDTLVSLYFHDIEDMDADESALHVRLRNGTRLLIQNDLVHEDALMLLIRDILTFYADYREHPDAYDHTGDQYNYRLFLESSPQQSAQMPERALQFQYAAGNPFAGLELANRFRDGSAESGKDTDKALQIYRNIQHPIAYRMMGEMYFAGVDVPKDTEEAETLFKTAHTLGDLESHVSLANFRFMGINGKVDYNKAFSIYHELATNISESLLPDSLKHNIGVCLKYGYGCKIDLAQAEKWFSQVCETDPSAKYMLADLYVNYDDFADKQQIGVKYLIDLEKQNYLPALTLLGTLYAQGEIIEMDIDKAFSLLTVSADAEDAEACYQLALLGICVPDNGLGTENAFTYMEKAANAGHFHAMRDIAVMYQFGIGVRRDICAAKQCYEKAAACGDVFSQNWKEHTKAFLNKIRAINYVCDTDISPDKDSQDVVHFANIELNDSDATQITGTGLDAYIFSYADHAISEVKEYNNINAKRKFNNIQTSLHHSGTAAMGTQLSMTVFSNFPKFWQVQAHGQAMEYSTHINDLLHFKYAKWIGGENTLAGADRRVGLLHPSLIQDKCFSPTRDGANRLLHECFNTETGTAKYKNQIIEVNDDLYNLTDANGNLVLKEKVDALMGEGYFNNHFKKSGYTHKQCENIAKFGNIDSLRADLRTGRVAARGSLMISGLITFGIAKINGSDNEEAVRQAMNAGIRSYGITLLSTTVTAQLLKTGMAKSFIQSESDLLFKLSKNQSVQGVLAKSAGVDVQSMTTTAAKNQIKTMAVSTAVTTVILSVPDILRVIESRESGRQLAVNVASTASSVAASSVGYSIGAACGSIVPVVGTFIGGLIGASIAGSIAGNVTRGIMTEMLGSDDQDMLEIFNTQLAEIAQNYLLAEDEINYVVDSLQASSVLTPDGLRDIFQSEDKPSFCKERITPFVEEVCELRNFIVAPSEQEIVDEMESVIREAEFIEMDESDAIPVS